MENATPCRGEDYVGSIPIRRGIRQSKSAAKFKSYINKLVANDLLKMWNAQGI